MTLVSSKFTTADCIRWSAVGVLAGFIGALTKSGVESLLPPRLPDAVPPPIGLLDMMGFDAKAMTYTYLEQAVNWGGNGVHILFSMVIGAVYCVLVSRMKLVGVLNGIVFGLVIGLGAHCIVLPLMGLGLPPWKMGFEEYMSEIVGSAIWIWTIDAIRRRFI